MKYAFMTFTCPTYSLAEALELARRFGYDGIEPRIAAGHGHGIETGATAAQRAEAAAMASDSGIALCCVATSCRFADPKLNDQMIDDARRAIDLAGDVGSGRLRTFGGALGDGLSRDDAIEVVSESLAGLADQAGERGVTICMETHDSWCDPAHVAAVMEKVNHPAVAVNWDIMHPVRTGCASMAESFETLKPWIRHLHFHDCAFADDNKPLDLVAVGTGGIDHKTAVERMGTIDADAYFSGEWIKWAEPMETYLPRELATMKSYES